MTLYSKRHACFCILLGTLLLAQGLHALPEDSKQPIHITADEAIRDEKTGETVYKGNVQINQGSLQIDADQVVIYSENITADKIVATGAPAQMQQQREVDGDMVYAEGLTIEYYKEQERMLLLKQAWLEQDGSTVKGDKIEYLIPEEVVKASVDTSGNSTSRVEVTIPPSKVDSQD